MATTAPSRSHSSILPSFRYLQHPHPLRHTDPSHLTIYIPFTVDEHLPPSRPSSLHLHKLHVQRLWLKNLVIESPDIIFLQLSIFSLISSSHQLFLKVSEGRVSRVLVSVASGSWLKNSVIKSPDIIFLPISIFPLISFSY